MNETKKNKIWMIISIIAFAITTIRIITESVIFSPCAIDIVPDTIAAIIKIIIIKSLNCLINFIKREVLLLEL